MDKKCPVPGWNRNYQNRKGDFISDEKTPLFRLPRNQEELSRWLKTTPYENFTISKNSVICEKHWPASYPTESRKGKIRPRETPSVWPGVPQSCVPTPDAPPRKTLKSSFEVRGAQPDEMNMFQEQDRVNYSDIIKRVISNRHEFRSPTLIPTPAENMRLIRLRLPTPIPTPQPWSRDTAIAIHHTSYGIVEPVQNLLVEESYEYICLAEISTDRLGKAFGKLRQGFGGAFFVTAQQVTEKLRINKSRLQITLGIEFEISAETTKHKCSYCDYVLEVELSSCFDNLPDLEGSVDDAAKTNLVHIAEYVLRKFNVADSGEDAFSYYEKYGD